MKETFQKKKGISNKKSFNLLPNKTFIQMMYVYIVRNIKTPEMMF